jgi:hypothetical protein
VVGGLETFLGFLSGLSKMLTPFWNLNLMIFLF